jgi:DNA polymerase-3 subunit delta'
MSFNKIINQDTAKNILKSAIETDRIPHAYLFYGAEGVGKELTAIELAKAMNCLNTPGDGCDNCPACRKIDKFSHPDVKLIFPTPSKIKDEEIGELLKEKANDLSYDFDFDKASSISIDTVRNMQKQIQYRAFEGKMKVYIILDVDRMTIQASNALLKTLEEPPEDTIIVLTTAKPYALLDTIRSRCQAVFFGRIPPDEVRSYLQHHFDIDENEARLISRLSDGSIGNALKVRDHALTEDRAAALSFLEAAFGGSVQGFLDFTEKMGRNNERAKLIHLLDILSLWFRDMYLIFQNADAELITNIDLMEKLEEMAENYSETAIEATIDVIEEIKKSIDRNVNVQLALIVFLLRLRKVRHLS